MKTYKKNNYLGYLLILPTFTLFFIFFIIPLFYSFYLSFIEWNGFAENIKFVGLDNYTRLIADKLFWNAFGNTLYYALFTVPICIIVSLILSVLISEKVKGYSFLKGAYFMPYIISLIAVSVVWAWIYSPGTFGLLNSFLKLFGIKPQNWLGNPDLAMASLIIIGIWKSMGYNIIIFIAGLKSIPVSLYEAATIDGASPFQRFKNITLPQLMPTIFFITVTSTIYAFFQVFDVINSMTQGGPTGATEVLVTYLHKVGFKQFEVGYASSIAFVLFVMIILITVVQKKFLEEK